MRVGTRRRAGLCTAATAAAVHGAALQGCRGTCRRPGAVRPGGERIERRRVGGVGAGRRPVVGRRAVGRRRRDAVARRHPCLERGCGSRRRGIEADRRRVAGVQHGRVVTLRQQVALVTTELCSTILEPNLTTDKSRSSTLYFSHYMNNIF